MAELLHASFANVLKAIDWMDEATRKEALSKLSKMGIMVGFPEGLLDDKLLSIYYSTVVNQLIKRHA